MGVVSNPGGFSPQPAQPSKSCPKIYRFGAFELRTETGELWKHGIRVKLQIKPLQVLEALLAKPGELVTREDLCKRLWPTGTFVDFESGLNTATNRLRVALGDSAESPRYIETLPRLGYRFICPVTEILQNDQAQSWSIVARQSPSAEQGHTLGEKSSPEQPEAAISAPAAKPARNGIRMLYRALSLIAPVGVALFAFAYLHSRTNTARPQPKFHQVTFRTGIVGPARFVPGSDKIVYTAKWDNGNRQTSVVDPDGSSVSNVDSSDSVLASVSRQGDLALIARDAAHPGADVRLSRVPLSGGSGQVVAEGILAADWSPDGRDLAMLQRRGVETLVEFPQDHVVYTSRGWIDSLRTSPRGDEVAFLEHPVRDDDSGYVRIVDRRGNSRVLTDTWSSAQGLAWSPAGDEVWFTASSKGVGRVLYAVSRAGKLRQVSSAPSSLRLLDIAADGRVLIAVDDPKMEMAGALAGEARESDLSKFDSSHVDDISLDGKRVLFTEGGEAGGQHYTAYIHDERTHQTFRVGSGRGLAISPDGNLALTVDPRDRTSLLLTAVGESRSQKIFGEGFEYQWAKFLPGAGKLIVGGAYPGESLTICTQSIDGGKPVPLNGSPYMDAVQVSPDGSRIAGSASNRVLMFDLASRTVQTVLPEKAILPVGWGEKGKDVYVVAPHNSDYQIIRMSVQTGSSEPWKTIAPADPGFAGLASAVAAPDAGAYVYSAHLDLSRLYVVDGWS